MTKRRKIRVFFMGNFTIFFPRDKAPGQAAAQMTAAGGDSTLRLPASGK
jgi:hypothetical protein